MTAAPSNVFAGVLGSALLVTGRPVDIVDAMPADFDRGRDFYRELGWTSTYLRFFGTPHIDPRELRTVGLTQRSAVEDGVVDVTLDLTSLAQLDLHTAARRQVALHAFESIAG